MAVKPETVPNTPAILGEYYPISEKNYGKS